MRKNKTDKTQYDVDFLKFLEANAGNSSLKPKELNVNVDTSNQDAPLPQKTIEKPPVIQATAQNDENNQAADFINKDFKIPKIENASADEEYKRKGAFIAFLRSALNAGANMASRGRINKDIGAPIAEYKAQDYDRYDSPISRAKQFEMEGRFKGHDIKNLSFNELEKLGGVGGASAANLSRMSVNDKFRQENTLADDYERTVKPNVTRLTSFKGANEILNIAEKKGKDTEITGNELFAISKMINSIIEPGMATLEGEAAQFAKTGETQVDFFNRIKGMYGISGAVTASKLRTLIQKLEPYKTEASKQMKGAKRRVEKNASSYGLDIENILPADYSELEDINLSSAAPIQTDVNNVIVTEQDVNDLRNKYGNKK